MPVITRLFYSLYFFFLLAYHFAWDFSYYNTTASYMSDSPLIFYIYVLIIKLLKNINFVFTSWNSYPLRNNNYKNNKKA